jgi:uncharacterized protein (TIGR02246 family)
MRRRRIPLLLAVVLALASVPVLAASDVEALKALDQEFAGAFTARDTGAIMAYYADDAVVMDPGPSLWIKGRDEIRKSFEGFFGGIDTVQFTIHDVTYKIDGAVAYGYGLWDLSFKDTKTGKPVMMKGRGVTVFEKRGGKWRAVVDHASVPLPAEPPK